MKAAIMSLAASALVLGLGLVPFSNAIAETVPTPVILKNDHHPILLARVMVISTPIDAETH